MYDELFLLNSWLSNHPVFNPNLALYGIKLSPSPHYSSVYHATSQSENFVARRGHSTAVNNSFGASARAQPDDSFDGHHDILSAASVISTWRKLAQQLY